VADELEEVTQSFEADMAEYTADLEEGADTAAEFAAANDDAKLSVDGLRDSGIEAGAAQADLIAALGDVRDKLAEVSLSSTAVAEAMGHLRDESLEAAAAEHELGDSADEAAAKLDLMGLSGLSTIGSLVPMIGIIGAIVIACAGVAPAVAAMALGFGAAAAFAIPTITQITGALGDTQAQLAKLPAPIRDVVDNVKSLESQWQGWAKFFQPEVLTAFDEALGIAGNLMQEILPLASQGFFAINGALMQIKAAIDSSGFKQFLAMMTQMVVPATHAIMNLAMTILGVLGQALEQLAPLSVPFINLISVIISALGGPAAAALKLAIGLIVGLGQAFAPLLPGLSQFATLLINDIGSSFQEFLPIISQVVSILGGAFLKILIDLEPIIANALTPNSPFMLALEQLPKVLNAIMPLITGFASILSNPAIAQAAVWIVSILVALEGLMGVVGLLGSAFAWLVGLPAAIMEFVTASTLAKVAVMAWQAAQWLLNVAMDANPIGLIVIAVILLAGAFALLWTHSAGFREFFIGLGHDIASTFDTVRHVAATVGDDIIRPFEKAVDWIKTNWKLILSWLVDPIGTAVFEIRTHTHEIAQDFDNLRHDVAAIVDGMGHDIETAWDTIRHDVAATVDAIPGDIEKQWDTIRHDAAALGDDVLHLLETAWHNVTSTTSTNIGDVVHFFEELPGEILHELEALPGQMLTVGKNIVLGVLHGVEDMASDLLGEVSNLAGDVEKAFTDPLSILSPSMVMFRHGQNYVQGIIDGIKSKASELHAAAAGLGTGLAVQGAGAAGAIAPASGGSTTVHVSTPVNIQGATSEGYSSPQFTQYLQGQVQEAVLRYGTNNPGNGLNPTWGRG
jgi:phage-related protein